MQQPKFEESKRPLVKDVQNFTSEVKLLEDKTQNEESSLSDAPDSALDNSNQEEEEERKFGEFIETVNSDND